MLSIIDTRTKIELISVENWRAAEPVAIIVNENDLLALNIKDANETNVHVFVGDFELKRAENGFGPDDFATFYFYYADKGNHRSVLQSQLGEVLVEIVRMEGETRSIEINLDVQSEKATRNEVIELITYVEERFPKAVRSRFGFTKDHGSIPDWDSVSSIIDNIASTIDLLHQNFQSFSHNRISRIEPAYHVEQNSRIGRIDDRSIQWLCANMELSDAKSGSPSRLIEFSGRRLNIERLLVDERMASLDVYENRVMLGFIHDIGYVLSRLRIEALGDVRKDNFGVRKDRSFPNLNKSFNKALLKTYQPYISAINKLFSNYQSLLYNFEQSFGPIEPIVEKPRITPTFSSVPGYREYFVAAQQWYSRKGTDKLFSSITSKVKGIWEVYELFCLIRMLEALDTMGFKMVSSRRHPAEQGQEDKIHNIFELGRDDGKSITAFYGPRIRSNLDGISSLQLVDTFKDLKEPDFVLQVEELGKATSWLILDAKFSKEITATGQRLDDILLSYGLRLSPVNPQSGSVRLLSTVYPKALNDGESPIYSRRSKPFGLESANPIIPAILSIADMPQNQNPYVSIFERLIDMESPKERRPQAARGARKRISNQVTEDMASKIKGMIARGDTSQAIAAWFGINMGRVSDVKNGILHEDCGPAPIEELPPSGPYESVESLYSTLGLLGEDYRAT